MKERKANAVEEFLLLMDEVMLEHPIEWQGSLAETLLIRAAREIGLPLSSERE